MKEFIENLKENASEAYGYIQERGYDFSKDELVWIIKEFIFASKDDKEILTAVAEELNDMYGEE